MSYAGLIFEGAVAALLLVAIIMCWRVDRRLNALKSGQDGVRESVIQLNDATDRARASLVALERATTESADVLEQRVREARKLSDELSLVANRADRTVDTMAKRAPRRRAADIFPGGAGSSVLNDLKDVR
ncbi:DUF6468 domain-containing protein [Maricaulis sp.]|uniref:DUF6468 domain-containing protein n=1 Tax=Maricaulis sp. TaxID=1486257 RepID=UPI0026047216|nr:DUF6468 domain-containing protein [Maricaulis sp.]